MQRPKTLTSGKCSLSPALLHSQCLVTTSTFNICSRCSPTLKRTAFAFFPCDLRVNLKGEKCACVHIYTYMTYIYRFPPCSGMSLGIPCKGSYLHLCKANPGHWSPQALHGWPLSIRPSPVNFKTKRQHKHVFTAGAPSKAPLCPRRDGLPLPPHLL